MGNRHFGNADEVACRSGATGQAMPDLATTIFFVLL
jgi:hypothetical protein